MRRITLITLIVISAIMLIGCYCERVSLLSPTTKTKDLSADFELKVENTQNGWIVGREDDPYVFTFEDSLQYLRGNFFYGIFLWDLNKSSHVKINSINAYSEDGEQYSCKYILCWKKKYIDNLPFSFAVSSMSNVSNIRIAIAVEKDYDALNVFYIDFNIEIDSVEYAHKVKYRRKKEWDCRPEIF